MKVNMSALAEALQISGRYEKVAATAENIVAEAHGITWHIDCRGGIGVAIAGRVDAAYVASGYDWLYDVVGYCVER